MAAAWEGFWQVLYRDDGESIVRFRDTTTSVRPGLGFSIFAARHFMELRSTGPRRPPAGWPPTKEEAIAMLRDFTAHAGDSTWQEDDGRWTGESLITMASDPRLEGTMVRHVLEIDGDQCRCESTIEGGDSISEIWRRLSRAGSTPLAGAWESGDPDDLWMYLVTAGHYGVIRTSSARPRSPADGDDFSDDELFSIWEGFGANAGARLETAGSFDHWPMLAQVAGYEVRKHETFQLVTVEPDRFVANLPPYEEVDDGWRRIG
ncbi:MAG: hypothetical protein ACRDVL_05065 [Acidimicrobiia bacterium]